MRIHVLSDLHMEHGEYTPSAVAADVVVLAGDINEGIRGLDWAARQYAGIPVVYVAGNHEYYGQIMPRHTQDMRARARRNGIHLLAESETVINGTRFVGTTLWTNFALHGLPVDPAQVEADMHRNDFRAIRMAPTYRRLRPADTLALHQQAFAWLHDTLAKPWAGPTVVVTHHAPSARSLPARFDNNLLGAAYASNLEGLIAEHAPALWIHGHTHHCVEYSIGATRVVSNACGYPMAPVPGFADDYVVDVPDRAAG